MEIIIIRYVRDDSSAEPMVKTFLSPHSAYTFAQDLESDPSVISIESYFDQVEDLDLYA
jgi:hypothetical protein